MSMRWISFTMAVVSAAGLTIAAAPTTSLRAQEAAPPPACVAPQDLVRLSLPLSRTARQFAKSQPLRIVALGSSSTAGAGASSPAMSYPNRLEAELQELFPRSPITVFNRGVNGETARDMLARFDIGVMIERPDLVLWQVGSNSVLQDQPVAPAGALLREGLSRLKAGGIDTVLINPQYAPKVIAKPDIDRMVDLIDATARETHVNLFQRFALMRYWRLTEDIPFSTFLSKDELHMNDWSYGCLAKQLAAAVADASTRPTVAVTAKPRS